MAPWGQETWGYYNWGTLGDNSVSLSGLSTTTSTGSVTVQQVPGWGTQYWGAGEWGDLFSPEALVTGVQISLTVNSISTKIDVGVIIDTTVTGAANIGMQTALGDELAGTSFLEIPDTNLLNTTVNSVFAGEAVDVQVSSPSNDEWGTEYWGAGMWGIGDGVTILLSNQFTIQVDADIDVNGIDLTSDVGDLEQNSIYEFPNGAIATTTVGDVFGGEVVEVQVTTASAQPWGYALWGDGQWGNSVGTDISIGEDVIGLPSQTVVLTNVNLGLVVSANTQPFIIADANVTGTSQLLTVSLGDEDAIPNTLVDLTGILLQTYLTNVVTGLSVLVQPTGVTANVTTGTIGLNAWAAIDSGPSPTWTVVDKAA